MDRTPRYTLQQLSDSDVTPVQLVSSPADEDAFDDLVDALYLRNPAAIVADWGVA